MRGIRPKNVYKESALAFAEVFRDYAKANERDYPALDVEILNILNAVERSNEFKAWPILIDLVEAIDDFMNASGYWSDLITAYELAIEAAERRFWSLGRSPEPEAWHRRITLRTFLASVYIRRGEHNLALKLIQEALKQSRRIKHRKLEGLSIGMLGMIAMAQGRNQDAERYHAEARKILEELGETSAVNRTMHLQALVAKSQKDFSTAWDLEMARLAHFRETGSQTELADTLCNLGSLAVSQGEYDQAQEMYEEARALCESQNNHSGYANVLDHMASLSSAKKDFETARKLLEEEYEVLKKYGDQVTVLGVIQDLAGVAEELGQQSDEETYYRQGAALAEEMGDLPVLILCLQGLGYIQQRRKNYEEAKKFYLDALDIARRIDHWKLLDVILSRLAMLSNDLNHYSEARKYYNEAIQVEGKLGYSHSIASNLLSIAYTYHFEDKTQEAENITRQALERYTDLGEEVGIGFCYISMAEGNMKKGDRQQAFDLIQKGLEIARSQNDKSLLALGVNLAEELKEFPDFRERVITLIGGDMAVSNSGNV